MKTYQNLRDQLLALTRDVEAMLQGAAKNPAFSDNLLSQWQASVDRIRRQLDEEVLRVAVVGAIKSGKSTFVNALLGDDVTKRGAGVVTSIVTRIRRGEKLSATLFLKSWAEVNADMAQALSFLPDTGDGEWPDEADFDIRNAAHRKAVSLGLSQLGADRLLVDGGRHPSAVLLEAYLAGYDRVAQMLSEEKGTRHAFTGEDFSSHRTFTGEDALSVYLRDIQLDVPASELDPHVEIADCQGSDSPNPLHLAMIQDYLVMAHLIVYVVSSRTGIREADIRFLSMIRKMGMMESVLFVVNCDFSEHESVESLGRLLERTRADLSLLKPDLEVYAFSCLYELFKSREPHLPEKDRERLRLWGREAELTAFSDAGSERFQRDFTYHLTHRRYSLLLESQLARLSVIVAGMGHVTRLGKNILSRDANTAGSLEQHLSSHRKGVEQLAEMVKNTLNGAAETLKKRLRGDVDSLFDAKSGLAREVIVFIRGYEAAPGLQADPLNEAGNEAGFSHALYAVFHRFRQALNARMAESVNPAIVHACRQMETAMVEGFMDVARPLKSMLQDAALDYNRTLADFGISPVDWHPEAFPVPDIEAVKEMMGLHLPPAQAVLNYSARTRTEAVVRLGFYRAVDAIRRFFKRGEKKTARHHERALRDGLLQVKARTEASVLSLFKDYRENLKFQYLFKLVDALCEQLFKSMIEGFGMYGADLEKTLLLVEDRKETRDAARRELAQWDTVLDGIASRVESIGDGIRRADPAATEKAATTPGEE